MRNDYAAGFVLAVLELQAKLSGPVKLHDHFSPPKFQWTGPYYLDPTTTHFSHPKFYIKSYVLYSNIFSAWGVRDKFSKEDF